MLSKNPDKELVKQLFPKAKAIRCGGLWYIDVFGDGTYDDSEGAESITKAWQNSNDSINESILGKNSAYCKEMRTLGGGKPRDK